jgi:chitinase
LFERENAEKWAAEYPSSRVFVGVSAEDKHGEPGEFKDLYYDVLYGGLMVWNRYYDKKNHFVSNS